MASRVLVTRAMLPLILVLATAAGTKQAIGVFHRWGAFRDGDACYAIARPVTTDPPSGAYASIGTWPARGLRSSLSIRLSRARDRATAVTLTVGERRFPLVASGQTGFAPDAPTDLALVGAIRQGRSMSIEAVDAGGRPFADVYALAGAATAIDAAALACAAR